MQTDINFLFQQKKGTNWVKLADTVDKIMIMTNESNSMTFYQCFMFHAFCITIFIFYVFSLCGNPLQHNST